MGATQVAAEGDVQGPSLEASPGNSGTVRSAEPQTQAALGGPPIISLILQDASVDPQHGHVDVPLGQDGFWTDDYSGSVTWRVLVGAVLNPALRGAGAQWTTITATIGPWGGGATALAPKLRSLAEPPTHAVVLAPFVDEFMDNGDNTPQAICNKQRQSLLDQGQGLSGILGNDHIVDITDDVLPRAQLTAELAYDPDESPYGETIVAVLPLRIRCLGDPEIAEKLLPSDDAPGARDAQPQRDNIAQMDAEDTPPSGASGSDELPSAPKVSGENQPEPPIFGATVFQDASEADDEGYVNVPLGQDGFWNGNYAGTVKWKMLIGQDIAPAGGVQWRQIDRKVHPFGGGEPIDLNPLILSIPEEPEHFTITAPYAFVFLSDSDPTPGAMCNDERQRLLDEGDSLAEILAGDHILDVPHDLMPQATLFLEAEQETVQTKSAETPLKLKIRCLGDPEIAKKIAPSDDAPSAVGSLEEFKVSSAELTIALDGGQPAEPATYAGSCPVDGQINIRLTANLEGTAQYQILHLSQDNVLTASESITTSVDDLNDDGNPQFDVSRTLTLPLEDATPPGFSTEPGGFVTGDLFVPDAAELIGDNDKDPNVHTGFFRVLAAPVGVAGPTPSLWTTYRIECDPDEGTVADRDDRTSRTEAVSGRLVLGMTVDGPPQCPAGSACPLQVTALNGGRTTIRGPLSIRIEPGLDGTARLGASNWACGSDEADLSCQSGAIELEPDETTELNVALIVPGDAEPGSQFRACAVSAPPRPDADPVRYTQYALTRLGFDPNGIDGRPGPNTLQAVREFQRDAGLPETGEIDSQLLQALADAGGAGSDAESQEACTTVAVMESVAIEPEPEAEREPVIVAPAPAEPERPVVVDPAPQVSVCRGGSIRGGRCLCPPGWTRTRISRFENVCERPVVGIVCEDGIVRGGRCLCPPGWRANRVGPNRFACAQPIGRFICSGGLVANSQCLCPVGTVRLVRGPFSFACVRFRS